MTEQNYAEGCNTPIINNGLNHQEKGMNGVLV